MDNILLFIIIVIIVGVIIIASPFVNTVQTLPEYQNRLIVAILTVALILLISLGIYGYLTGEHHWWLALLMSIGWIVVFFSRKRQEKKKRNLKKGKEIKNI